MLRVPQGRVVDKFRVEAMVLEEEREAVRALICSREEHEYSGRFGSCGSGTTCGHVEGLVDGGDVGAGWRFHLRRGVRTYAGMLQVDRGRKRGDGAYALVSESTPWHEAFVEVDVASVDDFAAVGDPDSIAAGHVGVEAEVDTGDAV